MTQLTAKEADLLRMLANGHTLKSAARKAGIAVSTMKDRAYICRVKLGADTNTQAVVLAAKMVQQ